ncbi:hypothetical protein AB0D11_02360 [Streptomyces monashensis]|uniref:hypothetical protein n=1 Tax=Streptomyces monashensis TaxID=1678012 RepID=UPI0033D38364
MRDPRVLSPPLPLATRVRLRAEHHIDGIGGWLVEHGHYRAAIWLWRACRMW